MTPMIWVLICQAILIMLPLVGIPAWLIVHGPEARRAGPVASARMLQVA